MTKNASKSNKTESKAPVLNDPLNPIADNAPETVDKTPVVDVIPTKVDYVRFDVEAILNMNTSDNDKWSELLKLAESRVDETKLPMSKCSDSELLRRLKLLWSKRVAVKKALEAATVANKPEDIAKANKELEEILVLEGKLNSYRTNKRTDTGTVTTDADPSTLDQVSLGKLIRNYQSRKCIAKKAGKADEVALWQSKVEEASKYRTTTPAQAKVAEVTNQLSGVIAALELLPQDPEVVAQIAKLKSLL